MIFLKCKRKLRWKKYNFRDERQKKNFDTLQMTWSDPARQRRCKKWDGKIYDSNLEKFPGCWEHISMVWTALKEAESKNLSLSTIWLDIANAYGSIPHKLIIFALRRFGVSPKWIHLIKTYHSEIFSKLFSQEAPSS